MPTLVIVAGPNGSGKTTLVRSGVLAEVLPVAAASINADDFAKAIASGKAPSDAQSLQAAQIADALLDDHIAAGLSVVVETVLSSDKLKSRVITAAAAGFEIVLIYVTLRDAELNIDRVASRYALGGHDVPEDRIRARRDRSHAIFPWFAQHASRVFVFDNTKLRPNLVAIKDAAGWMIVSKLSRLPPDLAASVASLAKSVTMPE